MGRMIGIVIKIGRFVWFVIRALGSIVAALWIIPWLVYHRKVAPKLRRAARRLEQ